MRTGSAAGARGFTYLWLLFLMAIGGVMLATAGERWSTRLQREREIELLARGREIAAAIAAYHAVPGIDPPQWPRGFDELLEDERGGTLRRHLRRAYADPFTGLPDWVPVGAEGQGWRGVRSRSEAPARLRVEPEPDHGRPPRVSDHVFLAPATAPAASAPVPAPPASQASGAFGAFFR